MAYDVYEQRRAAEAANAAAAALAVPGAVEGVIAIDVTDGEQEAEEEQAEGAEMQGQEEVGLTEEGEVEEVAMGGEVGDSEEGGEGDSEEGDVVVVGVQHQAASPSTHPANITAAECPQCSRSLPCEARFQHVLSDDD
jgi:hypothetical protein